MEFILSKFAVDILFSSMLSPIRPNLHFKCSLQMFDEDWAFWSYIQVEEKMTTGHLDSMFSNINHYKPEVWMIFQGSKLEMYSREQAMNMDVSTQNNFDWMPRCTFKHTHLSLGAIFTTGIYLVMSMMDARAPVDSRAGRYYLPISGGTPASGCRTIYTCKYYCRNNLEFCRHLEVTARTSLEVLASSKIASPHVHVPSYLGR